VEEEERGWRWRGRWSGEVGVDEEGMAMRLLSK